MKEVPANFFVKEQGRYGKLDAEKGATVNAFVRRSANRPLTFKPIWGCAKIENAPVPYRLLQKHIIPFLFYLYIKILSLSLYKRRKDERH